MKVVNDVLAEFCDTQLDVTKWDGPWHVSRGAVTQRWLCDTIIAGASAAVSDVLASEIATVRDSTSLQDAFKEQAVALLREDRQIYMAAMKKEIKKEASVWTSLISHVEADQQRIKAAFPHRPRQPGLDGPHTTILDLKHQAALAYVPFRDFMQTIGRVAVHRPGDGHGASSSHGGGTASSEPPEWQDCGVVDDLKSLDVKVTVSPTLKRAERIVQKIFLRGTVATICDVVRALVVVPDLRTMKVVHRYLLQCDAIQVRTHATTPLCATRCYMCLFNLFALP